MEQKQNCKKELEDVLFGLGMVDYEQEAFVYILDLLEQAYSDSDGREFKLVMTFTKAYMETTREKMLKLLEKFDDLLISLQ